ncbi:phosphate regulon sensor histidine kinase PhoR [Rhizobium sp. PvP099]|uniref:phosphate regulon sensor histidine kinase PhoR n=1 Tax=unclassified Rhizobium TaxID=2613769 RepID=UPI0032AFBE47|nr:two-component system phosphate regulon sensor histidine kinase PhoR [Rhizobium sp. PvP014]MBP2530710.1 two-component system phosphate regulon sensor histidine kinase PhoR [Rhizobium sp. PvP099]
MEALPKEERGFAQELALRFRREWLLLLLLSTIAVIAFVAGANDLLVFALWLPLVVAVLSRPLPEIPVVPVEMPVPEPPVFDPLPLISATLGTLDMPVVVLGGDITVLYRNKAAERAFGDLPIGTHLTARLRSPGILDMLRETIATGQPNQIEHSERLPSERVFILRVAPIDIGGLAPGMGNYYLLSFRDVSELRSIDRMRSDFVANASHELRTPLASLRGFIETIQGPARGDPKAQERFLGIMLDQATRMSRLVDDLLSLSRLELKSHIAPDQTVDLKPLIIHVSDALLPLAEELGVEIRLHLPEGRVDVLGDRDELIEVIENLIENACKYGQEGKFVDVFLKGGGRLPVEVNVIDKGPGIPAEHVPRLTERFYRVSVADSRSKKGTGLGLAIVKHILTRHRARLLVKSELGKGTEFTVRF